MILYKRFAILLSIVTLILTIVILRSGSGLSSAKAWRDVPQAVGLGEWVSDEEDDIIPADAPMRSPTYDVLQDGRYGKDSSASLPGNNGHLDNSTIEPPGSTYTKAVVMGRMSTEDVGWLNEMALPSSIKTYIYSVDDSSADLHTPQNKGNEAMVYLSYIIDQYDNLPDASIFLHSHKMAWHNNELLNHDATEMITRLSVERVTREGYMNLRCHWKPGCPEWVHPGVVGIPDINRPEEGAMADAWSHLFPSEPIPFVIGSACCAQFAVSRARIRSIPLERFKHYRTWLLQTKLPNQTSGRVFEYLWAYIFTSETAFCPDQRICYCDGYGACFEDEKEFDYWFELKYKRSELQKQLEEWQDQADWLARMRERWGGIEEKDVVIPPVDKDLRLSKEIKELTRELEKRRHRALEIGTDPRVRARVAGRAWKDGDGY